MRRRPATTLALALLSGGAAAYLALGTLNAGEPGPAAGAASPLQVVVAARDLAPGSVLGAEDVTTIDWPGESLPAGFVRSPAQVVGHGLLAPVHSNEPLLTSKLAGEGAGGGLPILIPAGMRAVSVRVDEVIAVAGFVVPGTRVDILATVDPGSSDGKVTRVVLQNVQVLAAGQSYEAEAGEPQKATVITLLVTPQEAEILTLAAAEARIHLALRNGMDGAVMTTPGAWIRALSGEAAPPAPRRIAPAPGPTPRRAAAPSDAMRNAVEIFNGSARSVVTFGGS